MSMSISRAFLLELSNSLGEKDLKQLKFLCKSKIGERQLEGIDEGYQLFEALEKRNLLSKNNKKFLASILEDAGRDDLSIKLNNYGNEDVGMQKGSPSVNELKPAIIPSKTAQTSAAADQIPQQGVGGRVSTYNTRELQEQLESFAIYDPPLNPSSSSTRVPPGHPPGTVHPFASQTIPAGEGEREELDMENPEGETVTDAQPDGAGQQIHEAATPEVFVSYKWHIQNTVRSLVTKLEDKGYRCWMDIGQMGGGDRMNTEIDAGIRASKVVICCVTKEFCRSTMCQNEVTLANSLGKPIIPLLFESMQWPPEGQLGLIFTSLLYIKMSGTLESAGNFPENKLQELVQKVRERVGH